MGNERREIGEIKEKPHIKKKISEFSPSSIGFGGPDSEFSLTVLFAEHYQFYRFPDLFDMILKICRRV